MNCGFAGCYFFHAAESPAEGRDSFPAGLGIRRKIVSLSREPGRRSAERRPHTTTERVHMLSNAPAPPRPDAPEGIGPSKQRFASMRKVLSFSLFLMAGLVASQLLPGALGAG